MYKKNYNNKIYQIYFFGALGSIVEWYDFAIYGYLASVFAKTFFINKSHWLAIVLVYAIFFISYLVRPLGALIYGYIGDHFGRRQALILSVAMMSVTMLIMTCLPTWYAIGALAPLFLLSFRIFQGISVGGETTGALIYILESVSPKRYGLYGSITGTIPVIGIFLGSSIVALLSSTLSSQSLLNWGWRLAYLIGFVLGLIIFIMRIFMPESTAFQQLKQSSMMTITPAPSPFKKALREYRFAILMVTFLSALPAVAFYFIFVYFPQYSHQYFHQTLSHGMNFNTLLLPIKITVTILFGYLADFVGKRRIATLSALCFLFFSYPIMHIAATGSWLAIVTVQILLALMLALYAGTFAGMIVELAPVEVRYTVVALGFNLGYAAFGGTAPLISSLLIHWSHNNFAPAFYLMAAACLTLTALVSLRMMQPALAQPSS